MTVALPAMASLVMSSLGIPMVEAQSTAAIRPVWRVDTLASIRFKGDERIFLGRDSLIAAVSHLDGRLVVGNVCACRSVRNHALPKVVGRASDIGGVAISANGLIWLSSSASPEVYLLEESEGELKLVESFKFGREVLAIASLSSWGESGAVVRVFNSESKAFGVLEQRVFGLQRGKKALELLNLTPYVPLTQTRVKVGSAERPGGVRWFAQPFRSDRAIVMGEDGTFAIGDSANHAVVVGTPGGRVTRTYGDGAVGRPLTAQEAAAARAELERMSRGLRVSVDSLPWRVPVTRQAIEGVWLTAKRLVVYAPSSEDNRHVDEFELASGRLRERLMVPAAGQFVFSGLMVDTWAIGMVKRGGAHALVRIGAVRRSEAAPELK
jgi:hypothetical protein